MAKYIIRTEHGEVREFDTALEAAEWTFELTDQGVYWKADKQ